jgi:hypothetical protein
MLAALHKQLHVQVFQEIVKGKYNPCLINKKQYEVLNNLVVSANTIKVATLHVSEKPESFVANNDLTVLGYKSPTDLKIETKQLSDERYDLIIKPLFIYEMTDKFDIPKFNGFKTSCYVEFLGDEYERIKIRAEKLLCIGIDDSCIREYVSRHVQISKNLFRDAKLLLRNIQEKGNHEDVFITFLINVFLLKTILFYQECFINHHTGPKDTECQLYYELFKELPLSKLCYLTVIGNSEQDSNTRKSLRENSVCSEGLSSESNALQGKTISSKKSQQATQGIHAFERIKVNGQINVLVDVFFQLLTQKVIRDDVEMPFIETSEENLQNFLLSCFKDYNNKPYCWHTINTYLKTYRTDKHIKAGSKRKIDISGHFDETQD